MPAAKAGGQSYSLLCVARVHRDRALLVSARPALEERASTYKPHAVLMRYMGPLLNILETCAQALAAREAAR